MYFYFKHSQQAQGIKGYPSCKTQEFKTYLPSSLIQVLTNSLYKILKLSGQLICCVNTNYKSSYEPYDKDFMFEEIIGAS